MLPVTSSISYNNIHDRLTREAEVLQKLQNWELLINQTNFEAIKFVLQRVSTLVEKVWLNIWAKIIFHKEAGKKFAEKLCQWDTRFSRQWQRETMTKETIKAQASPNPPLRVNVFFAHPMPPELLR